MSINFDYYKIFYTVANCGKISKAAEKLYITQPAVTQTIKKLEEQMDTKLFFRSKSGIELTHEGKVLYDYIKSGVENLDNAETFISHFKDLTTGEVIIGGGRSAIDHFVNPVVGEYIKKYPKVDISLKAMRFNERIPGIINGKVDIVIMNSLENSSNYNNIDIMKLFSSDEFLLLVSKEFAEKNSLKSSEDLTKNPVNIILPNNEKMEDIYAKHFEENNIKIGTTYSIDSSARLIDYTRLGLGIGCCARSYYDLDPDEYKDFIILDKFVSEEYAFYMATLRDELCNKAVKEFKKAIKEYNNI